MRALFLGFALFQLQLPAKRGACDPLEFQLARSLFLLQLVLVQILDLLYAFAFVLIQVGLNGGQHRAVLFLLLLVVVDIRLKALEPLLQREGFLIQLSFANFEVGQLTLKLFLRRLISFTGKFCGLDRQMG